MPLSTALRALQALSLLAESSATRAHPAAAQPHSGMIAKTVLETSTLRLESASLAQDHLWWALSASRVSAARIIKRLSH